MSLTIRECSLLGNPEMKAVGRFSCRCARWARQIGKGIKQPRAQRAQLQGGWGGWFFCRCARWARGAERPTTIVARRGGAWYRNGMNLRCVMVALAMAGWGWVAPLQAQTNGLFADFSTSAGTFTVELDFVRAPRTVANFVRLAEGTQSWMDPATGVARTEP